jgi:hypothetical protein
MRLNVFSRSPASGFAHDAFHASMTSVAPAFTSSLTMLLKSES